MQQIQLEVVVADHGVPEHLAKWQLELDALLNLGTQEYARQAGLAQVLAELPQLNESSS
jgi:hypothetical protein